MTEMSANAAQNMFMLQLMATMMASHPERYASASLPLNQDSDPEKQRKRAQAEEIGNGYLVKYSQGPSAKEAMATIPTSVPVLPLYALTPRQATDHDTKKELYLAHKTRLFRKEIEQYDDDIVGRREAIIKFGENLITSIAGPEWSMSGLAQATPSLVYSNSHSTSRVQYGPSIDCDCGDPSCPLTAMYGRAGKSAQQSKPGNGVQSGEAKPALDPTAAPASAKAAKAQSTGPTAKASEANDLSKDDAMKREAIMEEVREAMKQSEFWDPEHPDHAGEWDDDFNDPYDVYGHDPYDDDYDDMYGDPEYGYYDGYGAESNEAMFDAMYAKSHGADPFAFGPQSGASSIFGPKFGSSRSANKKSKKAKVQGRGKTEAKDTASVAGRQTESKDGNKGKNKASEDDVAASVQSKNTSKGKRNLMAGFSLPGPSSAPPGCSVSSKTSAPLASATSSVKSAVKPTYQTLPWGPRVKVPQSTTASVGLGLASSPASLKQLVRFSLPATVIDDGKSKKLTLTDEQIRAVSGDFLDKTKPKAQWSADVGKAGESSTEASDGQGVKASTSATRESKAEGKRQSKEKAEEAHKKAVPAVDKYRQTTLFDCYAGGKGVSGSIKIHPQTKAGTSSAAGPSKSEKKLEGKAQTAHTKHGSPSKLGKRKKEASTSSSSSDNLSTLKPKVSFAPGTNFAAKALKFKKPNPGSKPAEKAKEPKIQLIVYRKHWMPSKRPYRDSWHGAVAA